MPDGAADVDAEAAQRTEDQAVSPNSISAAAAKTPPRWGRGGGLPSTARRRMPAEHPDAGLSEEEGVKNPEEESGDEEDSGDAASSEESGAPRRRRKTRKKLGRSPRGSGKREPWGGGVPRRNSPEWC